MASKNLYHRRLTAESGAKACWICYKPSSTVLITPENDDWFHVCPGHLTDHKFAIPKDVDDLADHKGQEELDKEIEAVKKEFEEKMRKKLARRKQKEYEKSSDKTEAKKSEASEDANDETEKNVKVKELEKKKEPAKASEGPRIFELHKDFYQMRQQKRRDAEIAKRNRERPCTARTFPAVPSGDPGSA